MFDEVQRTVVAKSSISRSVSTPKPIRDIIPKSTSEPNPITTPKSFSTPKPLREIIPESTPLTTSRSVPTSKPVREIIPQSTSASTSSNNTNFEKLRNSLDQSPSNSGDTNRKTRDLTSNNLPNINSNNNPIQTNKNHSVNSPNPIDNNSSNSNQRTLITTFEGGSNDNKVAANPTTSNSEDGRASCVQCGTSYPGWARRRGLQGKIVVKVDTDSDGNVTNVELVSSSGSNRLDQAHLKTVRGWKLKPSENGKTGVTIATEYVLR
ncbi:MAG: energy transducer TonB [Sphaerospermopsis sp. SIO1G1]|nr:energy transducer TonB [Sphaerospermopsis sp. SIO1G1]